MKDELVTVQNNLNKAMVRIASAHSSNNSGIDDYNNVVNNAGVN